MGTAKDMASIIYEDLKEGILDLTLEPGSPVSEAALCERYEASRTPVRTALHRLADQNLIELLPYQQSTVSLIDFEAVKEFIYARVAIEDRVIRDFIALDKLTGQNEHADSYTAKEHDSFMEYIAGQLAKIDLPAKDEAFLTERMLTMYAYPAINFIKARQ